MDGDKLASDTSQQRASISGAPIRRLKWPKNTQLELRSMMKYRTNNRIKATSKEL
jgi:hypothetical protein